MSLPRWVRVRDGDQVDGCDDLLDQTAAAGDLLPWVVLFASGLGIRNPRRRRARIADLAAAYRELFP